MKRARAARRRVRVRESRFGRELIVDGTFASFYRPGLDSTGSVWDAIAAPLLALPARRRKRVLILGFAAGSAARLVRAIAPSAHIVGVERDAAVLREARKHFDLDAIGARVVCDDALGFLERDRGVYDAVLEDVFVGAGDAVHKPAWLPEPGLALAAARLARGGLLVSNALDEASAVAAALARRFPRVVSIEVQDYDNRIQVGGPAPLSGRTLRVAAAASPVLRDALPLLRFRRIR